MGGGFVLASLGTFVGGLVYNGKRVRPAAEPGRIGVVMSLNDDEKKRVRHQVIGKEPVDPKHVNVVRGAAVQTRKALATQLALLPTVPLALVPQFLRFDMFLWWLAALAVAVQCAAVVIAVQQFRAAGRFLASAAIR